MTETLKDWQAIRYGDSDETQLALAYYRERGWKVDDQNHKHDDLMIYSFQAGYRAALLAQPPAQGGWQTIETAPKDGQYVIIAQGSLLPDVAVWQAEIPEHVDRHGTKYLARPAGWFSVSRSRLNPTHWMPLPALPTQDKETR